MANKKIKGITIELGADPTGLYDALDGVEKGTNAAKSNLRDVDRAIKAMPESVALWSQKQQILTTAIEESRKKLQLLEGAQAQVNQQFAGGKISQDQFFAFERELEFARAEVGKFESQLSEVNDRFSRTADDAKEAAGAIEEMGEEAETAGEKAETSGDGYTVLKGAMADLAADGIRAAADALKELAVEGETALDSLQTKTGATADQMAEYEGIITDLYGKGMGEDKLDLSDSIAEVKQQLGDIDSGKLAEVSENALVLRDTFGFDIAENVRAASMLMQKFGITADEAYNLIAQGAQNGLNKNGDLMDVINEYGVHYSQLGYSAEEFFNSLYNGAATGVFSVDKLGDAMKEFGIRTKDTAESTNEGFALLGLNADEMRSKFAAGGESAKLATQETITALFAMSDKVKQNQAGVALFGTMWEDLGADAVKALTNVTGAADQTASTLEEIGEIKYDNLENNLERVTRKAKTDLLEPVVEDLLPLAEDGVDFLVENIPKVGNVLGTVGDILSPIVKLAGGLFSVALDGLSLFTDLLGEEAATNKKLKEIYDETTEAARKLHETTITNIGDFENLKKAASETAQEGLLEVSKIKGLKEELGQLVDAEGRVKEGYEGEISFIVGQLQEASGLEVSYVDGQIQKYDELIQKLDDVIAKKQATTIIDSYQEAYSKALLGLETIGERQSQAKEKIRTNTYTLDQIKPELYAKAMENYGGMYDTATIENMMGEFNKENIGTWISMADVENAKELETQLSGCFDAISEAEGAIEDTKTEAEGYIQIIDNVDEAEKALNEGRIEDAVHYVNLIQDTNAAIAENEEKSADDRIEAYRQMLEAEVGNIEVYSAIGDAKRVESSRNAIKQILEDMQAAGLPCSEGLTQPTIDRLNSIDGFDATDLISFCYTAGSDSGSNYGSGFLSSSQPYIDTVGNYIGSLSYQASQLRSKLDKAVQSAILPNIGAQGLVSGALNSLPKYATGGFIHQGEAIVAEAGPELIRIMEGGVQVTPLTATARNHAVESSSGQRVFYNQITVNATVSNGMDVTKLGQKLAAQLQASERGAGR